jgi:hypothetical protein
MPTDSLSKSRKVRPKDRPRYGTPMDVVRDYRLGRNKVFEIIRLKLVRTISIKGEAGITATKGRPARAIRLIDLDSLEAYLDQFATGPEVAK